MRKAFLEWFLSLFALANQGGFIAIGGDGDDDDDGGGGAGGSDDDSDVDDTSPKPRPKHKPSKKGNYDDGWKAAEARFKRKAEQAATNLRKLQETFQGTQAEKDELQARIEELESTGIPELEQTRKRLKDVTKKHEQDIAALKESASLWEKRFKEQLINTELTTLTVKGKAVKPDQVVALLRQTTELEEILDGEQKPTGKYKVMVGYEDKDGKSLREEAAKAVPAFIQMNPHFLQFPGKGGSPRDAGGSGSRRLEGDDGEFTVKRSDLKNPKFITNENRKQVHAAIAAGRVVDDAEG